MKMRPASHLPFLFVMAVLALLRAATAAGQYYTPYLQERSLEVRADAQVPPQESSPVVSDGRREESSDLGGFDGALAASAEAGQSASQPPYASGEARAAQTVAYTPTGFTGRFFSGFTLDENGGWSGGSSDATWAVEFRADQSVPLHFTARGVIRAHGGYFLLLSDLDTEDPHGGPLGLFGVGLSTGGSEDRSYDFETPLQAGHRYRLSLSTETGWEILRNPPVTQAGTVHGEFTFAVTVPEPAAAVALGVVAPLLLVRARRTIPSARTGSRSMPRPAAGYADLPGCR